MSNYFQVLVFGGKRIKKSCRSKGDSVFDALAAESTEHKRKAPAGPVCRSPLERRNDVLSWDILLIYGWTHAARWLVLAKYY